MVKKNLRLIKLNFEDHSDMVLKLFLSAKDFFETFENTAPDKELVEKTFFQCPDGVSEKKKIILGCFCEDQLLGFADLIRDRHREGEWLLGLLLTSKEIRKTMLGGRVILEIFKFIKNTGAKSVVGGVIEGNEIAKKFWTSIGATETEVLYDQEINGKKIPTRVVYKDL